jgi:DNA-binding NtrC family response regulator
VCLIESVNLLPRISQIGPRYRHWSKQPRIASRVVIVDNNSGIGDLTADWLALFHGFTNVTVYLSAKEALEALADDSSPPHVVVMSMRLEDDTGVGFLARLAPRLSRKTAAIAHSGCANFSCYVEFFAASGGNMICTDFIPKPMFGRLLPALHLALAAADVANHTEFSTPDPG